MPSWVHGDPTKESKPIRRAAGRRNASVVSAANRAGTRYDFVLYGDSITQVLAERDRGVWARHFGHLKSAPLGVAGNTVEELSWRLAVGKEKFRRGPRVAAVLIGINNLSRGVNGDPAARLDAFLLPWLRATWPDTRLVLLGILPNKRVDVKPWNRKYRAIAKRHGAKFATCGADLDPKGPDFTDGTHPSKTGYNKMFPCLRALVDSLLK